MNWLFDTLQKRPLVGAGFSIGSGVLGLSVQSDGTGILLDTASHPTIDAVTPYLSFIALGIGITVGILTAILKIMEIRDKRRRRRNDQ